MSVGRRALLAVALAVALVGPGAIAHAATFLRGADLSSLPQVEAGGAVFREGRARVDAITLLQRRGVNAVRLRLWHSPPDGTCGLDATLAMAQRLKRAGLPVLLDLHYSDTWADPGHQLKPRAWADTPHEALRDSVRAYTRDVVAAFRLAGAMPAQLQLGNEIGNGLLWPEGRIDRGAASAAAWARAAELLTSAAQGAREGAAGQPLCLMLHYEGGGNVAGAADCFGHMTAAGVPFDDIGLSYYPWWHGSLAALAQTIAQLHQRFGRPVTIVETAYPWSLGWWDDTHNVVGSPSQLVAGFPATPQGQRAFMRALMRLARRTPGCAGVYYWEPAWVSAPRAGSPWENVTLFDSTGAALPALKEFGHK